MLEIFLLSFYLFDVVEGENGKLGMYEGEICVKSLFFQVLGTRNISLLLQKISPWEFQIKFSWWYLQQPEVSITNNKKKSLFSQLLLYKNSFSTLVKMYICETFCYRKWKFHLAAGILLSYYFYFSNFSQYVSSFLFPYCRLLCRLVLYYHLSHQ